MHDNRTLFLCILLENEWRKQHLLTEKTTGAIIKHKSYPISNIRYKEGGNEHENCNRL